MGEEESLPEQVMLAIAESPRAELRPFRGAVLALVLFAWPKPCAAAPASSYSLTLSPNTACPDDAPIVARVAARVPGAERVAAGGDVVAIVGMVGDGTRIRAVVAVTRADGSVERPVSGSSCEDAADAVAFILALALDADTEVGASEIPPAASSAAETANVRTQTQAATVPAPAAPVVARVAPPPAPARPPATPLRFRWGGGVLLGASGGVAPALALTEGIFLESARRGAQSLTQSFRLTGLHAGQTARTPAGTAELDLFALRVHACPLGFGRALFVEGCASFDVGRLRGRGYDAVAAKSDSATWYGPGALGRAGAALGGPFEIGAELGFVVPLARDRFYFLPDVTAHTVPPVAGYGVAFVGFRP